jgi:transposase
VIEDIEFGDEEVDGDGHGEDVEVVVAHVRPRAGVSGRCGRCLRKAPWYDRGQGRRRWRGLDLGTVQWFWRPMHRG